jgi:uncharacterized membrane protein
MITANRNQIRQVGALLLEALMLVFVFTSSWSQFDYYDRHSEGDLVLSALLTEQISFIDSESSSERLLNSVSKFHSIDVEISKTSFVIPITQMSSDEALLTNHSVYNTFYTHLTAKAP